jgi:hypothetical protein
MPSQLNWGKRHVRDLKKMNVAEPDSSAFNPLTTEEIRTAFAAPAVVPPILSLGEAAELVKLRPQTLKRKVSEGLYAKSVVRGKPLRFWRDRLVAEVMR